MKDKMKDKKKVFFSDIFLFSKKSRGYSKENHKMSPILFKIFAFSEWQFI